MKTNKIMIVGAAFILMISCDTNSTSSHNRSNDTMASLIYSENVWPLSLATTRDTFSTVNGNYNF
jgi:hypothetical protein